MTTRACRRLLLAALAALVLLVPACRYDGGGQFTVLGYSSGGNFNRQYRTVRVVTFENETFYRGLEFELTRALEDEINASTPYRVANTGDADLELSGVITGYAKALTNINPLNEIRTAETVMTVGLTLRDVRTGEILSSPVSKGAQPPVPLLGYDPGEAVPGLGPNLLAPALPPDVAAGPLPGPGGPVVKLPRTFLRASATYVPELGESNATARTFASRRMAKQIVNMMEKPW